MSQILPGASTKTNRKETMSEVTDQEKYADKITKLLRKAESTTPEEAESLMEKAQQLMTQYAVDQAMLDALADQNREEIVEIEIAFTGTYREAHRQIAQVIARHNNCRVLVSTRDWVKPKAKVLHVIGFKSDTARVELLNTSLQIQCSGALMKWWRNDRPALYSQPKIFKARRQFIMSYAYGVDSVLDRAVKSGVEEAAKEHAERVQESETEASESVALVLRTRKEKVDDWIDEKYGKLRSGRGRSYDHGGYAAANAGHAAGQRADVSAGNNVGGGAGGALGAGS